MENIMDCFWLNIERIFAIWNNNLFISAPHARRPEIILISIISVVLLFLNVLGELCSVIIIETGNR